ncbi:MAG TPA: hypothetical protein P5248_10145, partial [Bacteroidales bacterium]|nr:hypothetical protein [Bacteroidales bacterium]
MKIQNIFTALAPRFLSKGNIAPAGLIIVLLAFGLADAIGQTRSQAETDRNADGIVMNPQLKALITSEGESGYMFFREDLKLDASDLFTTHKAAFNLGAKDEMIARGAETCALG